MTPLCTASRVHRSPIISRTRVWPTRRPSSSMQPRFSAGTDEQSASRALTSLLATSGGGKWTLASDGQALERTFKFKTFSKTWDFMTAVSLQCKMKNHHPEWSNVVLMRQDRGQVYNTTFVRWTTHSPRGLSEKDVALAALCDALARDLGEVPDGEPASHEVRTLADTVAASAGDCCVPGKK